MISNALKTFTLNADGTITHCPSAPVYNFATKLTDVVCGPVEADCCSHEHTPVKKEEAPKDAKSILVTKEKRLQVKNCKDGFVDSAKDIMPNIKDISVKADGVNSTVIFVTFTDGKIEKAVLDPDDDFSLEHGLTIIMLEKLLSDKGVDGKSVHNKLVNYAIKFYKKQEDAKFKALAKEEAAKEKERKIKEKIRAKKLKQARDEREYQIEIQKEAYLRAMREFKKEDK